MDQNDQDPPNSASGAEESLEASNADASKEERKTPVGPDNAQRRSLPRQRPDFGDEGDVSVTEVRKAKLDHAKVVAWVLVGTFAANLLVPLIAFAWQLARADVGQLETVMSAFSAFVEASKNYASAIFAPLLAFVLGYYFGEKRD